MNLVRAIILLILFGLAMLVVLSGVIGWAVTWLFYRPKPPALAPRRRRAF